MFLMVAPRNAVSLALILNLVVYVHRLGAGNAHPPARISSTTKGASLATDKGAARTQTAPDELSRYDPIIKLDLLKELQGRALPELDRNPFEFVAPPPPKVSPSQTAAAAPRRHSRHLRRR